MLHRASYTYIHTTMMRSGAMILSHSHQYATLSRHLPVTSHLTIERLAASRSRSRTSSSPSSHHHQIASLLLFSSSSSLPPTRSPMRISRPRSSREEEEHEGDRTSSSSSSPDKSRSRLALLASAGTTIALLGTKSKALLGILKLTKMSSLLSMLATTGAYSLFFGLPFAAGMVTQTVRRLSLSLSN